MQLRSPAVLFDLGNVLVKLRFERGLGRLASMAGLERPFDLAEIYAHEQTLAFNEGRLGRAPFLAWLSEHLGCAGAAESAVADAYCDIFDPWPEMEALAEEVIALGHPVYLMSNTDPLHYGLIEQRIPVLARFTGVHLSYDAGCTKPDPRFYTRAIERYGFVAAESCFIDDRADNVEVAWSVGIPSHVHTGDVGAVRRFLRERGVSLP